MKALEGKIALVTGSGQGVGRGIAQYLASQGATVITNNRKPCGKTEAPSYISGRERQEWLSLRGDANTTAEMIAAEGGKAEAYFCDVSDYNEVGKMIDYIADKYGSIDIVVNNAAITEAGSLIDITESDWDKQITVKMKGTFNTMKHAAPHMVKNGFGRFLNCASDAWVGLGNAFAYSAANAGIVGLTKSAAKELFHHNITCNAICPQANSPGHIAGFAKTLQTLSENLGENVSMSGEKQNEINKFHGDARNLTPLLAYLCTKEAENITGVVFSVTASGRASIYTDSIEVNHIVKENEPWTLDELQKSVREELLKGYVNYAAGTEW